MENFTKEITELIKKNVIRDIQVKMLEKKIEGFVISREIMNEILAEIEASL